MKDMDKQIQRIKEKAKRYYLRRSRSGMHLLRPLPEASIVAFEKKYGVRLPEGYRRFLLEIGNGIATPYPGAGDVFGLTIRSFQGYRRQVMAHWKNLHKPFPFTHTLVWEGVDLPAEDLARVERLDHGNLLLMDEGCCQTWHLIVTGPERGNMWNMCEVGIAPIEPRRDFLT